MKNEPEQIYEGLILLLFKTRQHLQSAGEGYDLSPVQGMLLITLNRLGSQSMQNLAHIMACDASNITGLTERLEAQGLIERISDERDKRVKKVLLTDAGKHTSSKILKRLADSGSSDLSALSDDERKLLTTLLTKLTR